MKSFSELHSNKKISFKTVIDTVGKVVFIFIKYFFKKKDHILFSAYDRNVYCDNSRYLFEYLSNNTELKVYWLTDNLEIQNYLTSNNYKFITTKNIFLLIWVMLKTKVTVNSGIQYFNLFGILDNNSTVKISTLHGSGPKATISRTENINTAINQIKNINKFDYINFSSKFSSINIGKRVYLIPNSKIINFGYPRCDQYFDLRRVNIKHKEKLSVNKIVNNFDINSKIILYTPTWRPYEYQFPLDKLTNIDYLKFDEWLKNNNYYFFYTSHSGSFTKRIKNNFNRIIYIDIKQFPMFDINEFMNEVDILLNDYATTSTDFALLNRAQIFFMPDYDYYYQEKGFIEDYRSSIPGEEIYTYDDLIKLLNYINDDPLRYVKKFELSTKNILNKYYESELKNSNMRFKEFIFKLLNI